MTRRTGFGVGLAVVAALLALSWLLPGASGAGRTDTLLSGNHKHGHPTPTPTAPATPTPTATATATATATPSPTATSTPTSTPAPTPTPPSGWVTESNPQTAWTSCNLNANNTSPSTFTPLSDSAAAQLVTLEPENRPSAAGTNAYVPTSTQIQAFRSALNQYNQTAVQANPYTAYVDGLDGLNHPSTDELIQWAAHKWGIPEDWLRAEYALESRWNQFAGGDSTTESASWYPQFPQQFRVYGTSSNVFESVGLTQERWHPDGSDGQGTEPLRWKSTAFNIDDQAATVRFYYDNPQGSRTVWGDTSYAPCQQWNSIGGWYEPYPWNNSGQANYIATVQSYLNSRFWTTSDFNITTAPSNPSALNGSAVNSNDVHLSWQTATLAPAWNGYSSYVGYHVYRDGSAQALFAPFTGTSFDDTAALSGTHTYRVTAVDSNGNESSGTTVTVSVP